MAEVIFVVIVIVLLLLYETVALFRIIHTPTITDVIQTWARETWLVPFLFGLLMGHFFWCVT